MGKKSDIWNKLDDAILVQKFRSGELDPEKLDTKDIKKAHTFWQSKKYNSFAKTYRKKCRKWLIEKTLSGARRGRPSK